METGAVAGGEEERREADGAVARTDQAETMAVMAEAIVAIAPKMENT